MRGMQSAIKYASAVDDIILQYTYPRLDLEVSKKLNHLLKSPFCVHPSTGRVCVPLLVDEVETFDPELVPTVGQLLMELEEASRAGDDKAGWERTSLRRYVEVFEAHVKGVVADATRAGKVARDNEVSMEF